MVPEIVPFRIQQIVDNGNAIQLSQIDDVQTEPLSQKQLIMENVSKKLDSETKEQVMPLLEAILHAQPNIKVKSYANTSIAITMPKNRYDKMGRPQVGERLQVDLKKVQSSFSISDKSDNGKEQLKFLQTKTVVLSF